MEISKATLDLFKNFSTINNNLLIKPGSDISTVASSKDIVGEVTVPEVFPKEAGIYNLNEFLGVVSLFAKAEFDFEDDYVIIKEGRNKIKYFYADSSLLTVPTKKVAMPSVDVEVSLSAEQIMKLQKASSALSVGDLAIVGDGTKVIARVFDTSNPTSNGFDLDLDAVTTNSFNVIFRIEKLKLYSGGYDVSISSKRIAKFVHKEMKLTYFIAVETNSTFK
jgi:hypothetical protein